MRWAVPRCFNPRAPCGARRSLLWRLACDSWFQSTRPVRGATRPPPPSIGLSRSFNPRAPCGARPRGRRAPARARGFNPRAPCGARPLVASISRLMLSFQSTRPVRGATRTGCPRPCGGCWFQSTRPVRGATPGRPVGSPRPACFNPRAPCGARLYSAWKKSHDLDMFQSTRPVRGATRVLLVGRAFPALVSIHAPRAGRDVRQGVEREGTP